MYGRLQLASKYLQYYLRSSNGRGHGVHSPFVFEFITKVLSDKTNYPVYEEVEALRRQLLKDQTLLSVEDMGAGSTRSKNSQRTIASIAKNAAKSKKFGQLLYRIAKFYQPHIILELGTSLGITSSYLAKARPEAKVVTLEGAKEILTVAKDNFRHLQLENIETVEGNFDDTLQSAASSLQSSIDLAFVDGNHCLQPTIQYFESILTKTNNFSLVILDDIHWSHEMEQAWEHCQSHASVTLSIDLFFIGILVFRKEIMEKQHFVIRF
ncbi:MAG: methyltransferase domain-containing protein [Bacteroidetes bacterium]|nr:MAG: methyltransferase domain-containing protein [Bacteroidota bacterium]